MLVALIVAAAALASVGTASAQPDAYGYDYGARTFSGLYENADRNTANNSGDPTRLRMEWNELYNLSAPEASSPGAWVTHSQRGSYLGGDGQTHRWGYSVRLRYTGPGSPWGYFSPENESYVDAGNSGTSQTRPLTLPTPGP